MRGSAHPHRREPGVQRPLRKAAAQDGVPRSHRVRDDVDAIAAGAHSNVTGTSAHGDGGDYGVARVRSGVRALTKARDV